MEDHLPLKLASPIIDSAVKFAAIRHQGQMRATEPNVPYIYHPIMVGRILSEAGYSDEVIAAGILHDTIEDTATSFEELEKEFGKSVANLVEEVTENKSLPWEERKTAYLGKILAGTSEAKAIATADKIHNASNLLPLLLNRDQIVYRVFTHGPDGFVKNYREFVDATSKVWQSPLLETLKGLVEELEKVPL